MKPPITNPTTDISVIKTYIITNLKSITLFLALCFTISLIGLFTPDSAEAAPPVLATIADITVTEGDTITITPSATDADGDILTYIYTGWMTSPSYTTVPGDASSSPYTITVTVSDGILTDSQNVTITVNVLDTTPPSSPTSVVIQGITNSQVSLSWGANIESDLSGYKIYFGASSGIYDSIIDVGNQTGYTISGLVAGNLYFFAITAYDSVGNESGFSLEVPGTLLICIFSISPTSNSYDSSGGTDSISVTTQSGCSWTATSSDTFLAHVRQQWDR